MSKSFIVRGSIADYARNTVIEEKGVLALIKDWDFSKEDDQTIVLQLEIVSGTKKGATQKDFVTFDPDAKMNWKYAALREAIGEPIAKENDAFDLGQLVGRYVLIDLVPSKGDKYQNLNYKKYNEALIENMVGTLKKETAATPAKTSNPENAKASVDVNEDDLPF